MVPRLKRWRQNFGCVTSLWRNTCEQGADLVYKLTWDCFFTVLSVTTRITLSPGSRRYEQELMWQVQPIMLLGMWPWVHVASTPDVNNAAVQLKRTPDLRFYKDQESNLWTHSVHTGFCGIFCDYCGQNCLILLLLFAKFAMWLGVYALFFCRKLLEWAKLQLQEIVVHTLLLHEIGLHGDVSC